MSWEWILPGVVGVIALIMSLILLKMHIEKKSMHLLLWSVGLFLWAISDFTQFYALVAAWTVPIYLMYFFSSIMLAGFLGSGTLYLVMRGSRIPMWYMWFNIIMCGALYVSLVTSPVDTAALVGVVGANAITALVPNILAAVVNIPAAFTFIGGAAYSFYKTHKLYALLITLGALTPAVGGTLAAVAIPELLPFTDFIGIAFLSTGFYLSFAGKRPDKA